MRPAADFDAPAGIDGSERADDVAVARHRRGGAEPALEVDRGGAESCPRGSDREAVPGACGGGITEIAVGRKTAPILVAAVQQVEQHRPADQRYANIPDGEAAAAFAQECLHAGSSVQSESGAAAEHDRIDALDRAMGFQ